jgi:hypothetical protein
LQLAQAAAAAVLAAGCLWQQVQQPHLLQTLSRVAAAVAAVQQQLQLHPAFCLASLLLLVLLVLPAAVLLGQWVGQPGTLSSQSCLQQQQQA